MGIEDIDEDVPYAVTTSAPGSKSAPQNQTIDDLFGDFGAPATVVQSAPATNSAPQQKLDDFDMFFAGGTGGAAPPNQSPPSAGSPVCSSPQPQKAVQQDLLNFSSLNNASPRRPAAGADDFLKNFVATASGGRPIPNTSPQRATLESMRKQFGTQSVDTASLGGNFVALLTPYEILGVSPTASTEEIRAVYKKKALQMHPDKVVLTPEQAAFFKKITDAYELLSDEETRRAYDAQARTIPRSTF